MSKPIKRGAIAGIVGFAGLIAAIFIVAIIIAIIALSGNTKVASIFLVIAVIIMLIGFFISLAIYYYAFFLLGKITKVQLLKVVAVIKIYSLLIGPILIILILIFLLPKIASIPLTGSAVSNTISELSGYNDIVKIWKLAPGILIGFIVLIIFGIVINTLFYIGILHLKKIFPIAKPTGILGIIGVVTSWIPFISIIGRGCSIIATIMEIILLFQASKKYEK